jgi:hypothetical protein
MRSNITRTHAISIIDTVEKLEANLAHLQARIAVVFCQASKR